MIYMDNSARYYISKYIKKICHNVKLLYIIWSLQSPNFNLIKNLCCIIKIQFSSYYHHIYLIEEMRVTINKEWKILMEEDYRKYIKSMQKWYKLIILAKGGSIKY